MPWHKRETLAVTHMKVHWVSLTILYILVWPHQLIFYSAVLVWTSGGLPPSTWWQIQLTKNSLKISLKSICMCANDSQNVTHVKLNSDHILCTQKSLIQNSLGCNVFFSEKIYLFTQEKKGEKRECKARSYLKRYRTLHYKCCPLHTSTQNLEIHT